MQGKYELFVKFILQSVCVCDIMGVEHFPNDQSV